MSKNFKEFQKKVADRKFSIMNSWKADGFTETDAGKKEMSETERLQRLLNQNLAEADSVKFTDGYFPLSSSSGGMGKAILFVKRGIRKLIKLLFGWYYLPLYHRRDFFNGKVVNALSCERDLITDLQHQITALRESACMQSAQSEQEHLHKDTDLQMSDDFYHDFEERFRGSRDLIRDRLQIYVPIIKEHLPDWSCASFVDVGSGRGEWLDILRENGAADYVGVDLNERQNDICRKLGHKVVCKDCIAYLASQPENSIDLITGFQIIEHLQLPVLMDMLKNCYRTLKPGGIILFETPNPQNLIVGADMFYIDPSHIRHIEPQLAEFLVLYSGFSQVRTIPANPCPNCAGVDPLTLPDNLRDFAQKFNDVNFSIFGPQDYAVFAVKE